ncbi:hypothetical protein MF406_18275 (plasmid) [Georgenia sp. TF02-10]|uniref:hypothetical protein n=1 Tax=Georgenia sp. TF02-10 TaxID=2917725 RepID=UPI001FA76212|nr:hypothetical protein [Georgenia sp. TF02-10]UNX56593.1 hypothetical protein MF406_18275 [Georgenia sp. TF02-10]
MASEAARARYPYPLEDPATLRSQQRAVHNLGQLLLDTHAEVDDDALRLAESWRSDTATTAVADVEVLATTMKGDGDRLGDAASALATYVGHVDDARGDIDGIRRRYDDAVAERAAADRDMPDAVDTRFEREEQRDINRQAFESTASGLDGEYQGVLGDLRTRARPVLDQLQRVLERFVGTAPPTGWSLGEVAFDRVSDRLELTGNRIEYRLRQEGLLTGPLPEGYYSRWLENADRQGVPAETIVEIAREHGITAEDFEVLEGLEEVIDPDGKSYFLLPDGISGDDARKAVLMTYVLNAGTDYGEGHGTDFTPEAYSADEVQRIIDRQAANDWSYDQDVGFVHGNGGRLVTTPNGMLMGLGGNLLQDVYSQKGGTAWGDIFMVNIDDPDDAAEQLRDMVRSGNAWYADDDGDPYEGSLDLDRLLHHEERHSRQWADKGYWGMIWDVVTDSDGIEEDAGLGDGGYR